MSFLFRFPLSKNTISAIGSLLSYSILSNNLIVWGTGSLSERSFQPNSLKLFPLSHFLRNLKRRYSSPHPDIRAVRGPKTRQLLEQFGITCPEIYDDPAILAPIFYSPKAIPNKLETGLILHHIQKNPLRETQLNRYNIRSISVERESQTEIESFIDEIYSCKRFFFHLPCTVLF